MERKWYLCFFIIITNLIRSRNVSLQCLRNFFIQLYISSPTELNCCLLGPGKRNWGKGAAQGVDSIILSTLILRALNKRIDKLTEENFKREWRRPKIYSMNYVLKSMFLKIRRWILLNKPIFVKFREYSFLTETITDVFNQFIKNDIENSPGWIGIASERN